MFQMFKKQKEEPEKISRFNNLSYEDAIIDVDRNYLKQIELIRLSKRDLAILKNVQPIVEENIDLITNSFYERLMKEKEITNIIQAHSSVDRLKKSLEPHIIAMFSGKIDNPYIERRIRVANAHIRIKLPTKWYLASFQGLNEILIEIMRPYMVTLEDYYTIEDAIKKIINLEQQLVIESYEENQNKKNNQLQSEVGAIVQDLHVFITSSSKTVHEAVDISEKVTEQMQEVNINSQKVLNLSHEAKELLNKGYEDIEKIVQSVNRSNQQMKELLKLAGEAEEIAKIVNDIADETNLLALNASIESARHGENGKAFAVIAERVRILSNNTKDSVKNISVMISNIENKIAVLHEELNRAEELAIKGKESSIKGNDFYDYVLEMVQKNQRESQKILLRLEKQTEFLKKVNTSMQEVYHQSDELKDVMKKVMEQ